MGHISTLLYPTHSAAISDKAAAVCSFLDDHTESESYNKHAAARLRRWPCMAAVGLIRWKIAHILFCLKSQFISPFEVYASKVMLWYNFTVFDPVLQYHN